MTTRMTNLDRCLKLVHALTESIEGLTLGEMAALLEVNRRTVERMRNVILMHFDLDEVIEGRVKRFRIKDSPGRAYTRPNSAEVAALQSLVEAGRQAGIANTDVLDKLLSKIKTAFDSVERRRIDNDLDLLTRLQRSRVSAGPAVLALPENLTTIQAAILASRCIEFDYQPEWANAPSWRRVVPYGLIHGPITYLLGKMPDRDDPPYTFRLDRMGNVRKSDALGYPPAEWDLDCWLSQSFGMWREEEYEIVLRVRAEGSERARAWRFHPLQNIETDGDELVIRFHCGGLFELTGHLFSWAGDMVIEQPEALKTMMAERLASAQSMVRPILS